MINYLERPAPSRLTPWPGNPVNPMFALSEKMRRRGAKNGRPGKKLKAMFKGKVIDFDSVKNAAEHMGIHLTTLERNVRKERTPKKDGLDWIEIGGVRFEKSVSIIKCQEVRAVVKGEQIIFSKMQEAMDFFGVTRVTIISWIKSGCTRDNGVEYIGYYG